ncbi:MAG TPA: HAMP domain-containing sensor histidine kinase, partial [Acidimicrobiales bacterium]|nr:HAMP domain-containing sensor histidine kinase [Acidimicrobiales bacterium]
AGMAELRRRAGEAVPAWVPVVFGVLAAGQLERAVLPAGGIAALAGSAVILGAFVLAATASLGDLRWILRSQDRLSMSLRFDLNSLRRQMEAERASLEDRLHDLRNAVAALRSADTTLRRYAGRLDEASRNKLADALTTELGRLQVLIEPARSASRVEFPIEEAIAPVVTVERSYGAVIHLDLGKLVGLGDPASLAQVLQNLLENARRYAGESPVEVSARERAGRVEIRVKDHGPGIPEHERAAIFSRGIRGSSGEETSGTGLGLFIAARLMIEMGGSLRLEEAGPAGSCFLVELPVAHRGGLGAVEPPTASVS